jgi:predicted secreted protein
MLLVLAMSKQFAYSPNNHYELNVLVGELVKCAELTNMDFRFVTESENKSILAVEQATLLKLSLLLERKQENMLVGFHVVKVAALILPLHQAE